MPRYKVTLTEEKRQGLQNLVQRVGKDYRIKHAQILLKLDYTAENAEWTYERIKAAYNTGNSLIASVAKRFVFEGMEAALGRKKQENYHCRGLFAGWSTRSRIQKPCLTKISRYAMRLQKSIAY